MSRTRKTFFSAQKLKLTMEDECKIAQNIKARWGNEEQWKDDAAHVKMKAYAKILGAGLKKMSESGGVIAMVHRLTKVTDEDTRAVSSQLWFSTRGAMCNTQGVRNVKV